MLGLMQKHPLLISSLIEFAATHHSDGEILSRNVPGDSSLETKDGVHYSNWLKVSKRSKQIANALDKMKVKPFARVATLAWCTYRHLELYFGVSSSARVLHTINPRLHPEQIAWIINHAEDEILCFDLTFLPILLAIHTKIPKVKKLILLAPKSAFPTEASALGEKLLSYEEWISGESEDYVWPEFDENSASSLCYTSGTTGEPKGVLYSHRSTVLHSYAAALPDVMGISARDAVLPVVPMFHVNAWGIPYAAALTGCKLVFPGASMDGKSLYEMIELGKVTYAAGVPTVWQGLINHLEQNNLQFTTLQKTLIGGAACPVSMIKTFKEKFNVEVLHAWGMTEMSPLGSVGSLKNKQLALSSEAQYRIRQKQGRAIFGVDFKTESADGKDLAWDGTTPGDLYVKGHWVVEHYFRHEQENILQGDWFPTGDVATIDADGFMEITDRSKDVIKSGGEWISSIAIENIAMAHPAVAMSACIGIAHPKWDERPLLIVVKKPNAAVTAEELIQFYDGKVSKWQVPDDVAFVEAIPIGATGKILKSKLREQFKDFKWKS